MRTSRECLEHAARCERLARQCSSPSNKEVLLQTAKQWRRLAELPDPPAASSRVKDVPLSASEQAMLEKMLSDVSCPVR
jgi:hypothetical protein